MIKKEMMLRKWIQNHKKLICEAPDEKQRDYIAMMWLGYLNGLRMAGAITWEEYNSLNDELQRFVAGMEAA